MSVLTVNPDARIEVLRHCTFVSTRNALLCLCNVCANVKQVIPHGYIHEHSYAVLPKCECQEQGSKRIDTQHCLALLQRIREILLPIQDAVNDYDGSDSKPATQMMAVWDELTALAVNLGGEE